MSVCLSVFPCVSYVLHVCALPYFLQQACVLTRECIVVNGAMRVLGPAAGPVGLPVTVELV